MKGIFKIAIIIMTLNAASLHASAQTDSEKEIKELENQEKAAVLKGDINTILKLWSTDLIVNNPANFVINRAQVIDLIKSGKIDYSDFDRIIEKISIIDNIAIVMGREEVKPKGVTDHSGKIVTRRFTNIWMKRDKVWSLVGRQATISAIQ